jgi:hypothetical protein
MADDLRPILDPVKVPDEVKGSAWDAYHGATDPKDFKARFDQLAIPDETKAALWDLKFSRNTGRPDVPTVPTVPAPVAAAPLTPAQFADTAAKQAEAAGQAQANAILPAYPTPQLPAGLSGPPAQAHTFGGRDRGMSLPQNTQLDPKGLSVAMNAGAPLEQLVPNPQNPVTHTLHGALERAGHMVSGKNAALALPLAVAQGIPGVNVAVDLALAGAGGYEAGGTLYEAGKHFAAGEHDKAYEKLGAGSVDTALAMLLIKSASRPGGASAELLDHFSKLPKERAAAALSDAQAKLEPTEPPQGGGSGGGPSAPKPPKPTKPSSPAPETTTTTEPIAGDDGKVTLLETKTESPKTLLDTVLEHMDRQRSAAGAQDTPDVPTSARPTGVRSPETDAIVQDLISRNETAIARDAVKDIRESGQLSDDTIGKVVGTRGINWDDLSDTHKQALRDNFKTVAVEPADSKPGAPSTPALENILRENPKPSGRSSDVQTSERGTAEPIVTSQAVPKAEKKTVDDPTEMHPGFHLGSETEVKTAAGNVIPMQWAVAEASDLTSSHDTSLNENPNFPADMQGRARSRAASEAQITEIENNLDPKELGANYHAAHGAPNVGKDGILESGNGRFNAILRTYEKGKGDTYKRDLLDEAEGMGLDPAKIAAMKQPVRVRVRLQPTSDRPALAREMNEDSTAGFSASERASTDAAQIGDIIHLFSPADNGEILHAGNNDFINAFTRRLVSKSDRNEFMAADGSISQQGVARIRNAVLAAAYGNKSGVLERIAESPDDNIRNVSRALLKAAPAFASLHGAIDKGDAHPLSIAPEIGDATDKYAQIRAKGTTVDAYLAQRGLFDADISPEATTVLAVLDQYKRSPNKITAFLKYYAAAVEALGNPKQTSMFGAKGLPSKQELIEAAAALTQDESADGENNSQGGLPKPEGSLPGFGEQPAEGAGARRKDEKAPRTKSPTRQAPAKGEAKPTGRTAPDEPAKPEAVKPQHDRLLELERAVLAADAEYKARVQEKKKSKLADRRAAESRAHDAARKLDQARRAVEEATNQLEAPEGYEYDADGPERNGYEPKTALLARLGRGDVQLGEEFTYWGTHMRVGKVDGTRFWFNDPWDKVYDSSDFEGFPAMWELTQQQFVDKYKQFFPTRAKSQEDDTDSLRADHGHEIEGLYLRGGRDGDADHTDLSEAVRSEYAKPAEKWLKLRKLWDAQHTLEGILKKEHSSLAKPVENPTHEYIQEAIEAAEAAIAAYPAKLQDGTSEEYARKSLRSMMKDARKLLLTTKPPAEAAAKKPEPFTDIERAVLKLTKKPTTGEDIVALVQDDLDVSTEQVSDAILSLKNKGRLKRIDGDERRWQRTKGEASEPKAAAQPEPAPQPKSEASPDSGQSDGRPDVPSVSPELIPGTPALIAAVEAKLKAGEALNALSLAKLAQDAFGASMASGKFDTRDVYDAVEVAVNNIIRERGLTIPDSADAAVNVLNELRELTALLPIQRSRTDEQLDLQQFSTPPALAMLANYALNPSADDRVLEPSAGTGDLAVWAQNAGTSVQVNEISPRRKALLELQGFAATSVDAEYLHDILPDGIKPTAIVMNPPFSSTGGRLAHNDTKFGAAHIEQALARLEDGGRLVAISGQGMAFGTPKFRAWWDRMGGKYNVRAVLGLPGKEYAKYGTTFDNVLIVIDKTGPTPGRGPDGSMAGAAVISQKMDSLDAAVRLLEGIHADRQRAPTRNDTASVLDLVDAPQPAGSPDAPSRTGGRGSRSGRGNAAASDVPAQTHRNSGGVDNAGAPGAEPAKTGERGPGGAGEGSSGAGPESEQPSPRVERAAILKEEAGGSFLEYRPQKLPAEWNAQPHNGNVVETAAMAATESPAITERPNLPAAIINAGKLSEVQLEAVSYAKAQHEKLMANGERAGMFIGDGTGVGKGRELAAIIIDNWNSGRKRALWTSFSTDLIEDARRDLADLGYQDMKGENGVMVRAKYEHIPLVMLNKWKPTAELDLKDGVIFTTYDTLKQGKVAAADEANPDAPPSKGGEREFTRVGQLAAWLPNDGVIVFDESHKAKNAFTGKGKRGKAKPTQTGLAVMEIQTRLPQSRIVYSSATGATEVKNMGYMSRLGIWGPGTPFKDFLAFAQEIESGGVGAMEMVARDLKTQGAYVSRFLSFEGVEFREAAHNMTADQREQYNTAAEAWQQVFKNIQDALETTNGKDDKAETWANSAFWGANQRFFRQFITALKVPKLFEEIDASLANNESIVISVMGTGEAALNREIGKALGEDLSLDDLDLSPSMIIKQLVEKSFPTIIWEDYTDSNGNAQKRPKQDADGNLVHSKEALAAKAALIERLDMLRFPDHPLDQIISKYGEDAVAEMTRRSKRLVKDPKTGQRTLQKRAGKDLNILEQRAFQDGTKRIAIISAAASTGISLHADKRAKNQQRRKHIILESKWSADQQMQDFGRTHRTNEVNAPEYVLMSLDVGGEKRFFSTIARRLEQLGALGRGQRDASGGGSLAKYNFESEYGDQAVQRLIGQMARTDQKNYGGPAALAAMGLCELDKNERPINIQDTVEVPQFLNRVLALDVDRQNVVFEGFIKLMEAAIEAAKEAGMFDEGVEDIKALEIRQVGEPEILRGGDGKTAKTVYYQLDADHPTHPYSFERAMALVQSDPESNMLMRQKRSGHWIVASRLESTETVNGKVTPRYRMFNIRGAGEWTNGNALQANYEPVSLHNIGVREQDAKTWWDDRVAKMGDTWTEHLHIIGGSILPVWDQLQSAAKSHGVKIVRLRTVDGKRVLGLNVPRTAISEIKKALGLGMEAVTPESISTAVLDENETIRLSGGSGNITLRRATVDGVTQIEIATIQYGDYAELERLGARKQSMNGRTRFFIPVAENALDVIKGVVGRYPVVGTSTGGSIGERGQGALDFLTAGLADRIQRRRDAAALRKDKSGPATPRQRIAVRATVKRIDYSDAELERVVLRVSGQADVTKVTRRQATEVLMVLTKEHAPGVTPWDHYVTSPSKVLGRSRAGAAIYEAAEEAFFLQQQLSNRFTENYHRVTKDLTKAEKDRIAQFRLKIDADGVRVIDAKPLSKKLAAVNADLTKFVFEPMFQRGVKEGLVGADRHIDDYLTYYRDDLYRINRKQRAEYAAQLSQELGIPYALAEKILEEANVKKVNFGPFDFRRLAETTPGLRDLDKIASIYVRGFGRKVAITRFLKRANVLRPQIKDEHLRRYAKKYIEQYAGKVPTSPTDAWFARTKDAIPLLRNMNVTAAGLAGAATSVQFMAKLGFNLFSPLLNLTQTVINTIPAVGAIRTFGAMPAAAAAILLPNKLNPFAKDLARLKKSGILDSLNVKFERPHFDGAAEKIQNATAWLFDKSEQFNRACAFLAGYEDAIRNNKSKAEAMRAARELVRLTQFFSGRLDSPLFARSPFGRVVMQFKVFTLKEIEFVMKLTRNQKLAFALASVAMGGPAAFGVQQAVNKYFPSSDVAHYISEAQDKFSLAGQLQADHLAKQFGIFMVPGVEDLGERAAKERIESWVAGPTFSSVLDVATAAFSGDKGKAARFTKALGRGFAPGGSEFFRVQRAMKEHRDNPKQFVRDLFGFYEKKTGGHGLSKELRELLGLDADPAAEVLKENRRLVR